MSMAAPVSPPPLRDGDHLTSEEFLRRWEAMPNLKHAELIDGTVYMPSPVSNKHGRFHYALSGWTYIYAAATPGCSGNLETTWVMGDRDVPQPDIALQLLPEFGGQSGLHGEYGGGAPELIVEVALSSRSRDLGSKLRLYEHAGVREYLVAIVSRKQLVWHELSPQGYQIIEPGPDRIQRSRFFPGLWLDPAALWNLDLSRMNAVLQQGLASPEHAGFVNRLSAR